MFTKLNKWKLIEKAQSRIREAAIDNAKKRLALKNLSVDRLSPEELEGLVDDEERKIKENLKKGSLVAVAVALGMH